MKKISLFCALIFLLSGCSEESETEVINEDIGTYESNDSSNSSNNYDSESNSPYTEEELENDPSAPSTNPNDYNSDGEYVPENGSSDSPADYNSNGEYKPVEEMTQDEIEAELEEMLGESLGQ